MSDAPQDSPQGSIAPGGLEGLAGELAALWPEPIPEPASPADYSRRGVHLDAAVPPERTPDAARLLAARGFAIDCATGVDWIAEGEMEVVYDFFHPTGPWRVAVRARVPRETPELPTISDVFPGANWHERETHDFFGIRFSGHPCLEPLLLPEDADFHPLRKDYAPQG
jgi:NADH-quinone oxidoreductase subunit C